MATNLRISTTTSVVDSRLYIALTAAFNAWQITQYGQVNYTIVWNSVGSGAAMQAARDGLADVVISHDRIGELDFLNVEHFALSRIHVFYNYFVVVGPPNGPVTGPTLEQCFRQINTAVNPPPGTPADPSVLFVSRGPTGRSGTYVREQQIWKWLNITPPGNIVPPPGTNPPPPPSGMNATLTETYNRIIGNGYPKKNAYTLTDIGTWYAFLANTLYGSTVDMTMLTSPNNLTTDVPPRDRLASNQYVVMRINPNADFTQTPNPPIDDVGSSAFLTWMLTTIGSTSAKTAVDGYLINISPPNTSPVWKQGFIYNANVAEHFPDDPIIQPVP